MVRSVRCICEEALHDAGVPPPGAASQLRCDSLDATSTCNRSGRPRRTPWDRSHRPAKCLFPAAHRALPDGGGGGPWSANGGRVKIRLWEYVLTYKDVTGTGCRKVLQLQKICSWPSYEEKGAFGVDWGRKCKNEKVRAESGQNPCRKVLQLQKRACCGRSSRTCGGRTENGERGQDITGPRQAAGDRTEDIPADFGTGAVDALGVVRRASHHTLGTPPYMGSAVFRCATEPGHPCPAVPSRLPLEILPPRLHGPPLPPPRRRNHTLRPPGCWLTLAPEHPGIAAGTSVGLPTGLGLQESRSAVVPTHG